MSLIHSFKRRCTSFAFSSNGLIFLASSPASSRIIDKDLLLVAGAEQSARIPISLPCDAGTVAAKGLSAAERYGSWLLISGVPRDHPPPLLHSTVELTTSALRIEGEARTLRGIRRPPRCDGPRIMMQVWRTSLLSLDRRTFDT